MITAKKNPKSQDSLEWQMDHFVEHCELCGKKMKVHAFCQGNNGKGGRAVYAHCEYEKCGKKWKEVSFQEANSPIMKCSHCNETLVVSGERRKATSIRGALYAYCNNKDAGGSGIPCRKYLREICFLGSVSVKQKPTHHERQVLTKQIMNTPRVTAPEYAAIG